MVVNWYYASVVVWLVIPAFQYGYHLSALNQLQASLSCRSGTYHPAVMGLSPCVEMDDASFGLLTSIFTIGGLAGSLSSGFLMDRYGRKGASVQSAVLTVVGSAMMSSASYYFVLLVGRLLVGMGAGIGVCVVPVYLAETAPDKIRGSIVVLNQLAIVVGILVTQSVGIPLARPQSWRLVLVISGAISLAQCLTWKMVPEAPAWLADHDRKAQADLVARRLWGANVGVGSTDEFSDADVRESLLTPQSEQPPPVLQVAPINMWGLVKSKELRRPVIIILWTFTAQQGSGINAVMYYSNAILGRVLPEIAAYVSLLVAVINVLMTFPPIVLVDRLGRRSTLLMSVVGTIASAVAVAIGLNVGNTVLSSVGILVFVGSFAVGLGPIPFVMVSEMVPSYAVGSLSALALSFNWLTNFIVGVAFLPLRNALAGSSNQQGNVFYVFSAILAISGLAVARMYHS